MTDPGFFQTLYTARALRRLTPDPVPDDVLFQIVDAAIRAPSGQNAQDWRFVLARDRAIKTQLRDWALHGWRRYQPQYADDPSAMDALPRRRRLPLKAVAHLAGHLDQAPVVVVICGQRGRHSTAGGSVFPAVQNLLLAARALGLGGSIFNLPLAGGDALRSLLGIPDDYDVNCIVPVGYPADRHGPLRRRPVRSVAFLDRWDEPWPFAADQPEDGWQHRWLR